MKIGIIGAGTMGRGIALAFTQKEEHRVILCDLDLDLANQALEQLKKELSKLTAKGVISSTLYEPILDRITTGTKESVTDCHLVIEAVQEKIETKKKLFVALNSICTKQTIFASNTSSLSITELNEDMERQVIGLHFFNPVPLMKLVEIVTTKRTPPDLLEKMKNIVTDLGKIPVITKDHPGFVVNRILIPMINEAIGVLASGTATAEDIDLAMKLGANHPIGPLALADLIGLDVCLAIMEVFLHKTKNKKYQPQELLLKMVTAGHLGRKTGKGFFTYQ